MRMPLTYKQPQTQRRFTNLTHKPQSQTAKKIHFDKDLSFFEGVRSRLVALRNLSHNIKCFALHSVLISVRPSLTSLHLQRQHCLRCWMVGTLEVCSYEL